MIFKSSIITEASGSVNGLTYSHNLGGLYIRSRVIPVNPNSAAQQDVRGALAAVVSRWSNVLTQAQRDAWRVFADNVPLVNRLGDPKVIPALAWYVKANVPRVARGKSPVDTAPTDFSLANLTEPTPTITAPTTGSLAFTNTDGWAGEAGGYLFLQVSPPQNATINFYNARFSTVLTVAGAATPPTSPATFTYPWSADSGQRIFWRAVATRADGRPSNVWQGFCVAA